MAHMPLVALKALEFQRHYLTLVGAHSVIPPGEKGIVAAVAIGKLGGLLQLGCERVLEQSGWGEVEDGKLPGAGRCFDYSTSTSWIAAIDNFGPWLSVKNDAVG